MEREEALRLYEENEKLVFFILNKYYPAHAFDEDAVQEGRIGLWNACQSYDPERSAFSTYAGRAIRNAVTMSLRQEARLSKLPTVSLSSVVGVQKGGEDITLEDTIPGETGVDFVDTDAFLARLNEREERIVRMRARGMTLKEIGAAEGMSHQGVLNLLRRIRRKAYKEWEEFT